MTGTWQCAAYAVGDPPPEMTREQLPISAVKHNEHGIGSMLARRYHKAIELGRNVLQLQADFKIAYVNPTWAYIEKDDHKTAAKALESYLRFVDQSAPKAGFAPGRVS